MGLFTNKWKEKYDVLLDMKANNAKAFRDEKEELQKQLLNKTNLIDDVTRTVKQLEDKLHIVEEEKAIQIQTNITVLADYNKLIEEYNILANKQPEYEELVFTWTEDITKQDLDDFGEEFMIKSSKELVAQTIVDSLLANVDTNVIDNDNGSITVTGKLSIYNLIKTE